MKKENLGKAERERVKQASRDLLESIKTRLSELDRFWEKEQTKADVEVFILRRGFRQPADASIHSGERKLVAANVYSHVWQQAVNGVYARTA